MKHMILAVIFTAAPAAAQTRVRVPVSGISAIAVLGATFDPARLAPPPLLPNVAAFNPLAPTPGIPAELVRPFSAAPAPVQLALAISIHAASAKPADNPPLGVIRDASSIGIVRGLIAPDGKRSVVFAHELQHEISPVIDLVPLVFHNLAH